MVTVFYIHSELYTLFFVLFCAFLIYLLRTLYLFCSCFSVFPVFTGHCAYHSSLMIPIDGQDARSFPLCSLS